MTKNNGLVKLSDNVKLYRRKDPIAMEMARTKDYYQKSILEAFVAYVPEQAVIYEMDGRFVSHAIYFLKYGRARQVYLFETDRTKYKEARNDAHRNHMTGIECLQPEWETNKFVRRDKEELIHVTPRSADVIHASKAVIEAGALQKIAAHVEQHKPVLWLDTSSHNFAEMEKWLESLHYQVQKEQDYQAIYVYQAAQESGAEEENELEAKLLERLETYKRQIEQLQREYEQQIAQMQAEQTKKIVAVETEYRAVVAKWEEEAKKQADLAKQNEQKNKQSQKETREARQVVQHISDALNAEKAINHDLNKRIFALLAEEKPVLLTMEKRQTEQQKELSALRYENRKLTRNLTIATEKYQRLNDTKVIRVMRKYWNFKKKRRLRNDT